MPKICQRLDIVYECGCALSLKDLTEEQYHASFRPVCFVHDKEIINLSEQWRKIVEPANTPRVWQTDEEHLQSPVVITGTPTDGGGTRLEQGFGFFSSDKHNKA